MQRTDELETLIVAAPLAVYALDRDGVVTLWNATAERIFGWSEDEVLGEPLPIVPELRGEEERRLRAEVLAGRTLTGHEGRRLRKDGSTIDVSVSVSPVRGTDGSVEGIVAFVEDISDRKRAELLLVTQFAVMDVLAGAATSREAVPALLGALGYGLGFDVGVAWEVDPAAGRLRSREVWQAEASHSSPLESALGGLALAPGEGLPGRAWAEGRALWEETLTADGAAPEPGAGFGLRSAVAFPVFVDGETTAVLELLSREPAAADADRLRLLAQVGVQLTQFTAQERLARERRRVLELEQHARRGAERAVARTERLQAVLRALGDALTPGDVYSVVLRETMSASGALGAVIVLLDAQGEELEIVASEGYSEEMMDTWRTFPLTAAVPASEAVRTRTPVLIGSPAERDERYPELASTPGRGALAVMPLVEQDESFGALALSFAGEHRFEPDEQALLEALAQASVQALERARLYALAEHARTSSEASQERQRFLIEVTDTLGSSLNYRLTLRRLAQLAVPRLADWCSVDVLDADGSIRSVALAHVDPDKVRAARKAARAYAADPEATTGPPNVIRTGTTEVYAPGDESEPEDEHRRRLRRLGLEAAVIVPLTARGRTLGSMSLISAGSGRRFEPGDVAFAEELARRAAFAVDNARLFEAERRARRQIERLQGLTASLSEAGTSEQVGTVVTEQAVAAVGANAGAILLLDADGVTLDVLASSGFSEQAVEGARGLSVEARVPAAECVGSKEAIWVEDVASALERWEAGSFIGDRAGEAYAAVPLVVGGQAVGAIALSFEHARRFAPDERGLILTLAELCAQAIERARLYEQEQAARATAEAAQERVERIQEILELGLAHLSVDELLDGLVGRVTTLLGTDSGAILLVDEQSGELRVRASVGIDPELVEEVRVPVGLGVAGTIAASGQPLVLEDVRSAGPIDPFLRHRAASLVGVPLRTEEGVIGVLHLTTRRTRRFAEEELALLEAVAARAALAIERSRLFEREHRIAETLQLSMLPQEMPELPGLEIVARYVPGSSGLSIGGDWYDALALPHGRVGVVVGDIVGKGLRAATEMVQLRNTFRAYALEGLDPAEVIERLNVLVERQGLGQYSTLVYAVFDPRAGSLVFGSAGHPPPLVRRADGSVVFLEGGRSLPLGVAPDMRCEQAGTALETGATLLLFTDGLVERRDAGIGDGLARLADAVRAGPDELEGLVDHLVEGLLGETNDDDAGLIALRPVSSQSHLSLDLPAEPSALARIRRDLRTWLQRLGADAEDVDQVTLACNEALANAIEHPVGRRSEVVRLEADVVEGILSIAVRDTGRWRHPSAPGERGLGLRLIGELMDDVEVNRSPDGTEVRMSRGLHGVDPSP